MNFFRLRISLLAIFVAAASAAQIPQGAHVLLRLENSVSTRTAQAGDFVYLRTAVPIANGGDIAVPAGSYVQGVVAEARRSGRVKGRAQLAIRLETLTLRERQSLQIRASSKLGGFGRDRPEGRGFREHH